MECKIRGDIDLGLHGYISHNLYDPLQTAPKWKKKITSVQQNFSKIYDLYFYLTQENSTICFFF